MSIRAFRTLQAIARHGSFAQAGQAVGLTQSAISLQVKALEAEFGAQLFDRSRRRPQLTEAGKIVTAKAAEILALYDQIEAALGDERSLTGRLRLGAIQGALHGVLPLALADLSRAHPRLRVHVSGGLSAELAQKVSEGELDLAITSEPVRPYPANLRWSGLYRDPFWLIVPSGLGASSLDELLRAHHFIRLHSSAWTGRMIEHELRRMGLEPREEMVFDSPEVILRMVENGLGIAVLAMTDEMRARTQLTCLPFGTPQLTREMVLLERADAAQSAPIATALAQAIRAHSSARAT